MLNRGSSLWLLFAAGVLVTPALSGCANGNWQDDYAGERCYIAGEDMTMSCNEKWSSASCGMRLSTNKYLGPGPISLKIKAAPGSGVATTFYLSTNRGVYDMSAPWNEIDFEILGNTATPGGTKVWTNLFTGTGEEHHQMISVPFDVSADFHLYTLDLTNTRVKWLVDGVAYRTEDISNYYDVKYAVDNYKFRPFVSLWGKSQSDPFVACPEFMEAMGRMDWNQNAFPLHASFKTAWNPPVPQVTTAAPTPPIPPEQCGLSEQDMDYIVVDKWWRQIDDIAKPDKCCTLCEQHAPDCKSWTWFPSQCWLKGDVPHEKKFKATLVSGLPRAMPTTTSLSTSSTKAAPKTTKAAPTTTPKATTKSVATEKSTSKVDTTSARTKVTSTAAPETSKTTSAPETSKTAAPETSKATSAPTTTKKMMTTQKTTTTQRPKTTKKASTASPSTTVGESITSAAEADTKGDSAGNDTGARSDHHKEIMDSMLVDKFQSSDDWALQRPNLSGPSVPAIVGVFAVCAAVVVARRRARGSFYEAVEGSSPLTTTEEGLNGIQT